MRSRYTTLPRFLGAFSWRIGFQVLLILANSSLAVVLDEATSHLDDQTERAVQEARSVELAGCAHLVVAHRLATVGEADQIVVRAHGRIQQRGTHIELLAEEGPYRRLVMAQNTVQHQV